MRVNAADDVSTQALLTQAAIRMRIYSRHDAQGVGSSRCSSWRRKCPKLPMTESARRICACPTSLVFWPELMNGKKRVSMPACQSGDGEPMSTWMLTVVSDSERGYRGHLGYTDDPRRVYGYDSFVFNYRRVPYAMR